MSRIRIGTSGWSYSHWAGSFYPEKLQADEHLAYYAERFDAVEINNTFYQLPKPETLQSWREQTPADFEFSCKASRYLTHMKKLNDPADGLERFFGGVDALDDQLGPALFQLPPNWNANPERLASFLEALPEGRRYVFEFRDESWFTDVIYDLLRRHNVALCLYDLAGRRSPIEITADLVYLRLHGPESGYRGSYDGRTLNGWARRLQRWQDEGRDVYCFFNNDEKGYAPHDAQRLEKMLD